MKNNTEIEELFLTYVWDEEHPTDMETVLKLSERYLQTMEDSQVRVLFYQLIKFLKKPQEITYGIEPEVTSSRLKVSLDGVSNRDYRVVRGLEVGDYLVIDKLSYDQQETLLTDYYTLSISICMGEEIAINENHFPTREIYFNDLYNEKD